MMTDLFTTAMAWIQDQGLPEPDSLRLMHDRIEMDYHRPASGLPEFGWTVSGNGSMEHAELMIGDVLVSIYAQRAEVPA